MIHYKTFDDLARAVADNDRNKWDRRVHAKQLEFRGGKLQCPEHVCAFSFEPLTLTPKAIADLCQFLDIPKQYFEKCPPILQDVQFNYWLQQCCRRDTKEKKASGRSEPAQVLLRCKGTVLRAVLGAQYPCFDHRHLVDFLVAHKSKELEILWFGFDAEILHVSVVILDSVQCDNQNREVLYGFHLTSSEIELPIVTIRPTIAWVDIDAGIICPESAILALSHTSTYDSISAVSREVYAGIIKAQEDGFTRLTKVLDIPNSRPINLDDAAKTLVRRNRIAASQMDWIRDHCRQGDTSVEAVPLVDFVRALAESGRSLGTPARLTTEIEAGKLLFYKIDKPI